MKKLAKLSLSQNAEMLNNNQMKMVVGGYGVHAICLVKCGNNKDKWYSVSNCDINHCTEPGESLVSCECP